MHFLLLSPLDLFMLLKICYIFRRSFFFRMCLTTMNRLHKRLSFSIPPSSPPPPPPSHQTNHLTNLIDQFLSSFSIDIKTLVKYHSFIITSGHRNNIFITSKLISLYSSLNKPNVSSQVFSSFNGHKDTFLWNSIIKSHFSGGDYVNSLEHFSKMHFSSILPNPFTIPMIVTASAELSDIEFGRIIHCFGLKFGLLRGNVAIGSSFVYMYCKCNELGDAENMFDEMTMRDVVSWTAIINGYVQNDEFEKGLDCFREMHKVGVGDGEKPNVRTIDGGLKACGNLGYVSSGRCLHGYMVKTGNEYSQFVKSSLLSMYSKCGATEDAAISFLELDDKDLISMTTIIGVYARKGRIRECLYLFREMQKSEIDPDEIIISCILSGLGNSKMVSEGKAFHGMIIRRGFKLSKMVINSLISMYSKFGCLNIAENLFDRLFERDVESWNHMISGYNKLGLETKCLELFREMLQLRVEANKDSLVLVLSSCSESALIGRSVHCYAIKNGEDANISVANSLVGMYGRCKNLTAANRLFRRVQKDVVTWNTLIAAYTHSGHSNEAISLFEQMISADVKPDSVTLKTVLSACSHQAALEHGKRVHSYIKEMGLEFDLSLVTSLVDMYVKCGELQLSREIFDSMPKRDVISWNVMISGYGINGDANAAVELFQQMEDSGVRPNGLSFLAVLLACTHAGLVEAGKDIFSRMERYAIQPTLKHYACMVDLLGRAGYLHEAENLVLSMPIVPDGGVWGSLLGCCRTHNDVEMAERVAKRAIELDPKNDGYYILMANMLNSMGMWEKAEKVREDMNKKGVRKKAGWSAGEQW